MGQTAENVAEYENVSRLEMDEFALRSQDSPWRAKSNGFFEREIIPVTLPDGTVISKDDGPRAGTTLEKLAALKPVFREGGTVTAGNACPLNDGAAAVIVMSDTRPRSSVSRRSRASSPAASAGSTQRSWGSAPSRPAVKRWRARA